ncbi:MAG: toprim domain-containing protein [Proteobacteria bacterium]|nr:toprim domain-containing protein [Pseudomonadota bacterium]MBU1640978.1 toprim domain-containing protein [Pseudomonadota bacterium]
MIEQSRIEAVKGSVDLVALVKSRGVKLRKNGKGYKGPCPFHEDSDPSFSVNPDDNLWNCFGCNKGGDAIRFVELFDQIGFKEAVSRLESGATPKTTKDQTDKPEKSKELAVKERKLLARVVDYYQHTFSEDSQGLDYLKERGINDHQSLNDFGVGFVNGSLRDILPDDEDVIKTLKELGILNKKGNEIFYNCVVFPLYDQDGAVVNLYGRNISAENQVNHLYLAGSRSGLVNRQAVKRSSTIILTESIIDALTLYDQGFKNVIPAYGVNGLTDDHLSLFNRQVKEIYIVFDNDEAGKEGAAKAADQLQDLGISSHLVELPDKDINIYFNRHTPEEFENLLKQTNPASLEQSENLNKRKKTLFINDQHGFTVGYGGRQYQVKGIQRGDTQLKATIKVAKDVADSTQPFELTTIDLYSSRSRVWFAKLCAGLLEEPEELVKEDLGKILTLIEEYKPQEEEQETIEISKADEKLALSFLKSPEMFSELLADFQTLGVTGEETNKLVGYLAATSRKLDDPLSVFIQSRSAAGKSTLQDAILSLVPEEDFEKYTRMSDQALFYKDEESLMHKILAVEEAEGMGGAAYSIRNIQSAKQITVAVTGKDPSTGKMRTETYKVKGPVCVMITTTATEIDQETASRFIFLTIDESTAMTEAIHQMQREAESLEGLIKSKKQDTIIRKHHAAQRLLKPLGVVNPFANYLSYPANSLRSRRDHKKYLGLIRVIAFIHQYQRQIKTVEVDGQPVEYIEVTLDDIKTANQLANEVLGQTMDELAKPSRTLLSKAYSMAQELAASQKDIGLDEVVFTRRQLREYTGWTDWQIKNHIKQLEDMEYLVARIGSKGKEYSYVLNYQGQAEESDKCYLNLTTVEEIERQMAANSESSVYLEG